MTKKGLVTLGVAVLGFFLISSIRGEGLLDRHFIYFPESSVTDNPLNVGLEYEDVYFSTSDGYELHGWFIPGPRDLTLLWFHGNSGNIGHRVQNIELLHRNVGANIFIFDYRGYGLSEGSPSEAGLYLDGEASMGYLLERQRSDGASSDIVLFGRSLGAAVAVKIASSYSVRAVILESSFTAISALAKHMYPFLPSLFVKKLFEARYDSLSLMNTLRDPLLVIHGDQDGIVPIEMGRQLYEAATVPKVFNPVKGADHNDTYIVGGAAYFLQIKNFIEDSSHR